MAEMDSLLLAQRLKQLRSANGFTQAEVAQKIGVHKTTIMRWENGEGTRHIKMPVLEALADIFHVSPAYLMGWLDEPLTREEDKLNKALDDTRKMYKIILDYPLDALPQNGAINRKLMAQVMEINRAFLSLQDIGTLIGEQEAKIGLLYLLSFYGLPWQEYGDSLLLRLMESELMRNFIANALGLLKQ